MDETPQGKTREEEPSIWELLGPTGSYWEPSLSLIATDGSLAGPAPTGLSSLTLARTLHNSNASASTIHSSSCFGAPPELAGTDVPFLPKPVAGLSL